MTKEEINNKKNTYKYELNDCTLNIDKFNCSINSCNKLKKYFKAKTPEKQKLSNSFLTVGIASLIVSIFCIFTTPFIATIFLATSFVSFERHFFFKNVTKKFKHCTNFFSKMVNRLNNKKLYYINQKEFALEQIYKLENEIPDEIIETLAMIENDEISELADNAIIQKCIERTSKTNEETIRL